LQDGLENLGVTARDDLVAAIAHGQAMITRLELERVHA